ncbi:hypothetical protein BJ165DRAFT_1406957 [Panaeolus papilionaceus]|nr:hypothetical protein BJ165DRAFT_1406957 [Panaeolus papilionaceus]
MSIMKDLDDIIRNPNSLSDPASGASESVSELELGRSERDVLDYSALFLKMRMHILRKRCIEDTTAIYELLVGRSCGGLRDAADVYEHDMRRHQAGVGFGVGSHRFSQNTQKHLWSHVPCGTPVPSTTEDPTTTSLFAEDKSLNASKAKAGERDDKAKVGTGAVEGIGSREGAEA